MWPNGGKGAVPLNSLGSIAVRASRYSNIQILFPLATEKNEKSTSILTLYSVEAILLPHKTIRSWYTGR